MRQHTTLERARSILQRRVFLKAMGLGLALPVASRLARDAVAAPGGPLKRMVVIYIPHGIAPEHYNPQVGSDPTMFDLDKTNQSILGPLQKYKSLVNVYQGFRYAQNEQTHEGIVNILSGVNTTDDTTRRTTMEHVIGKALGIKPLILGACSHIPTNFDHNAKLFWDGTAIEPAKDPSKVADTLFGMGGSSTPATPAPTGADPNIKLRSELLKLTGTEIQELQKAVTGLSKEQSQLQTHLDAVNGLMSSGTGGSGGSGSGVIVSSCMGRPSLPTVDQVRKASAGQVLDSSGSNDYFYQPGNFPLLFKAQLELTAQALICGAAPIIGLMPMYATAEFNFQPIIGGEKGLASGWEHHTGLSHTNPEANNTAPYGTYNSPISVANLNATKRETFGRAQRWFTEQIVDNLIAVLAATKDPSAADDSTVLDNSLVYLMSEIGDGQMHTKSSFVFYPQVPNYLPLVSIGKAAGALKTGQVLNYPVGTDKTASMVDRPATELYLTFAQAMGASGVSFPEATNVVKEALT